ncbi:MAG TPA: TIGR03668 family PPOX class F420-dependent oxidoreductase [Thermodesulfobacteriota bacterium]
MINLNSKKIEFIKSHMVARMATVDILGRPRIVPICYCFDGKSIYTPIDKKPKTLSPGELKRIRNILENPNVSLVIDEYYQDWSKLCYIIINGRAEIMEFGEEYQDSLRLLCEKYPQYVDMKLRTLNLPVIKIVPERIISWGNI